MYFTNIYDGINAGKELAWGVVSAVILVRFSWRLWLKKHYTITFTDICMLVIVLVVAASYYSGHGVNGQHKALLWGFGLAMYFWSKTLSPNLIKTLLAALMLSAIVQSVWALLQLYSILPSMNTSNQPTGTFVNTPMLALYLGTIFPFALYYTLQGNSNTKDRRPKTEDRSLELEPPGDRSGAKSSKHESRLPSSIFLVLRDYFSAPSADRNDVKKRLPSSVFGLRSYFSRLRSSVSGLPTSVFGLPTLIAILLVLPVTLNRASWLMVLISSTTVVYITYGKKLLHKIVQRWHKEPQRKMQNFILASLVGLLLLGSVTGAYLLKKDSADGRLFIYRVAVEKALEKPLFGNGTGSFEAQYNNWQAAWFQNHPQAANSREGWLAGNVKFAYNEYLEILTENGFVGLLLFLALIALTITAAWKNRKQNPLTTPLLASLIALLACATVSYPFRSTPTFLLFFLFAGIISSNTLHRKVFTVNTNAWHSIPKKYPIIQRIPSFSISNLALTLILISTSILTSALTLILISTSILTLISTLTSYSTHWQWDEARMFYNMQEYQLATQEYKNLYPQLKNNGNFLIEYGKALQMNEQPEKAIAILNGAKPYISDVFMYSNLGDCYKATGQYQKAEKAYQWAQLMIPHRMYPGYLMAHLYNDMGDTTKARTMASRVLQKPVKVESKAVEEIFEEMKEITKSN